MPALTPGAGRDHRRQGAGAWPRAQKLKPLTVAVLDAGGHLVAFKREDHSSILRPQIAEGKAWGVLGMGFGGREFARRAASGPLFLTALMAASDGRIMPVPGGVLIRDADGAIIGAVGITGERLGERRGLRRRRHQGGRARARYRRARLRPSHFGRVVAAAAPAPELDRAGDAAAIEQRERIARGGAGA